MFSFLNSTFLLAAAAALIPLIIHLFSKRKVKTVEFSSVRHLKAMQKRQVRKLKIKQYLLLLLRMLIILLVVLAFARPTTKSNSVGAHAAVTGIIVLDNSGSMNRYVSDGLLYNLAVNQAKELLSAFSENDEIYFITTTSNQISQSPLRPMSAVAVLEQINNTSVNDQRSDFTDVLNIVKQISEQSSNLQKEIYIITDRQRSSLPESEIEKIDEVKFIFVSLPNEIIDNCGLTSVSLGGQLILPGHDFKLTAQIKNYASIDNNDLIASLYLDNNRVAQTDISLSGGGEKEISFNRSVSTTGYHHGYVELSDDKFPSDNRYYFSFYIPEKFNLLIIDGDNNGPIISLALTPSSELNQNWSVKSAKPDNLTGIKFWEYDVIVLSGAPSLNQSQLTRLNSFMLRGKSILITYDINTDIDYFNQTYTSMTGVTIDKAARKDVNRAGYYALDNFDLNHPLFTPFNFENNKPPEIKFYSLPNISVDDSAQSIMNFSGNRPALIENSYQGGRVLTFCGPLHPAYSEMTINAFWVPFISRSAEYLAAGLSAYELNLKAGDIIRRELPDKISLRNSIELIKPDSSTYTVIPQDEQGRLSVTIDQVEQSGIYKIISNNQTLDLFAVNLPLAEGDLSPLEATPFAAAIGAIDFELLPEQGDLLELITQFRFGRELWPIFLWLAVILFAVEIWLSKSVNESE